MNDVLQAVDRLTAEMKTTLDTMDAQVKSTGKTSQELQDKLRAHGEQQLELAKRLQAIEQRGTPEQAEGDKRAPSLGEAFVKEAGSAYADLIGKRRDEKVRIEIKNTVTTADALAPAQRAPGIMDPLRRRLTVEAFLPSIPTQARSFEYMRENVFVNNAAEVAEGALKPESSISFTTQTASIRTIAHWIKISEQLAADEGALVAWINTVMRYGVDLRVENQLINGNGVGENISGILNTGNFVPHGFTAASMTAAAGANFNRLDVIRRTIAVLQVAELSPSALIVNPLDAAAFDYMKDANGNYIFGGPAAAGTGAIWGMQPITTPAISEGTFLVADFPMGAAVLNRQDTAVELGRVNDDFTRNLFTLRAERRVGLAIFRPAAMRGGLLNVA